MPSSPRGASRTFKFLLLTPLFLILAFGSSVAILWQTGAIGRYFEKHWERQIIDRELKKIAPSLPFVIESYDVQSAWNDFKTGKITDISLVLRREKLRFRLHGPLELIRSKPSGGLEIHYHPMTSVEWLEKGAFRDPRSTEIAVELELGLIESISKPELTRLALATRAPKFDWQPFGIELKEPALDVSWKAESKPPTQPVQAPGSKNMKLSFEMKSGGWTGGKDKAINLEKAKLELSGALGLKPFALGADWEATFSGNSSEILWQNTYMDLPLNLLPSRVRFSLGPGSPPRLDALEILIGSARKPGLKADVRLLYSEAAHDEGLRALEGHWESASFQGSDAVRAMTPILGLSVLNDFKIKEGKIQTQGRFDVPWPWVKAVGSARAQPAPPDLFEDLISKSQVDAALKISHLSFSDERLGAAVRDLNLTIPLKINGGQAKAEGRLAAQALYFKHFSATLPSLPIFAEARSEKRQLSLDLAMPSGFPLQLSGIPLHVGPVAGKLGPSGLELLSSLKIDPLPLERVLDGLCLNKDRFPPMTVQADFPKVELSGGEIDPTGGIRAEVFGGTIEATDLGLFELGSDVPEADFTVKWDQIRLKLLGDWLNFGEMDGIFTGHAEDVVFQGWLPTQYHILIETKPLSHSDIVFSPDAMKNLIELFAGQDIEHMPNYAQWLAFGLPSRLLGGYNVLYAGLTMDSEEGRIFINTLDPPKILKREQKHFILYGPRFKMPLVSPSFPVIVDATAVGNYIRMMSKQLSSLAKAKKRGKQVIFEDKPHEQSTDVCSPPPL